MNQEKTLEEKLRELSLDDLNKWTVGYITQRSNFNTKGLKCSDETRAKLSKASMGKKPSDETRAKLSKANMGKKPSDETKAKIGKAHKGKVISDETRAKISLGNKGKVKSDEHKAKISAANTGKKWSDNIRAKKCKLTEAQVLEIRSKYIPHKYTSVMLGKEYGLQAQAVMRIINRISWNHI